MLFITKLRVSGFREAILIFARRGIEVVFELNGLCLMAQKNDAAAAVVRKAWGLFSIYKPHQLYIVNYSLHKRIDKLEAVVKSLVAKYLGIESKMLQTKN